MAKSDPRGGIRSEVLVGSAARNAGSAGLVFTILQALVNMEKIDVQLAFLIATVATAVGSFAMRAWSELNMTARIVAAFDRRFPPAGIILLAMLLGGCGVNLGRVTPHQFSTLTGETLIACEVVGVQFAFGDADICRNVEGGHVSKTFADMTLGVIETAGRIIAGFFGGAGAGVGQALAAAPPAEPHVDPGATVEVPVVTPDFRNPFTAPDPD